MCINQFRLLWPKTKQRVPREIITLHCMCNVNILSVSWTYIELRLHAVVFPMRMLLSSLHTNIQRYRFGLHLALVSCHSERVWCVAVAQLRDNVNRLLKYRHATNVYIDMVLPAKYKTESNQIKPNKIQEISKYNLAIGWDKWSIIMWILTRKNWKVE